MTTTTTRDTHPASPTPGAARDVFVGDRPGFVAGVPVTSGAWTEVRSPFSGALVGRVAALGPEHAEAAVAAALAHRCTLTRHARSEILTRAGASLVNQREELARLITSETGLCIRETRYEVTRAADVLRFAAMETLHDDGEIYSCDVSATGPSRRIYTCREPLRCVVAITPFNHPLNTVIHKLAPAVAAGTPVVLKPSEKTPLTALRLAELLYQAGLPGPMLSVLLGASAALSERLVQHEDVEAVSFTGSTAVGRRIAATAGYKKLALELGGNSPMIVCDDADLDLAVTLAAEGSYRNSGQRCTAVKRMLVHEPIAEAFVDRLTARTAEYVAGDPHDDATRVGTVIDEASARRLVEFVDDCTARGALVRCGGKRHGALMEPTVIDRVPRDARVACEEAFGPLSPVFTFRDLDDAIAIANASPYGLATAVVTTRIDRANAVIRGVRTGMVNVNEVPAFRLEHSPFGGVKGSGLGVKEGVREARRWMSAVKTYSMPW